MWLDLIQSVEGLKSKRLIPLREREFYLQAAFGLRLQHQLFPGTPALYGYLADFWLARLQNCMSQFLKVNLPLCIHIYWFCFSGKQGNGLYGWFSTFE